MGGNTCVGIFVPGFYVFGPGPELVLICWCRSSQVPIEEYIFLCGLQAGASPSVALEPLGGQRIR